MAGIYLSRWDKRTRDAQSIPVDRKGRSRKRPIYVQFFNLFFMNMEIIKEYQLHE